MILDPFYRGIGAQQVQLSATEVADRRAGRYADAAKVCASRPSLAVPRNSDSLAGGTRRQLN